MITNRNDYYYTDISAAPVNIAGDILPAVDGTATMDVLRLENITALVEMARERGYWGSPLGCWEKNWWGQTPMPAANITNYNQTRIDINYDIISDLCNFAANNCKITEHSEYIGGTTPSGLLRPFWTGAIDPDWNLYDPSHGRDQHNYFIYPDQGTSSNHGMPAFRELAATMNAVRCSPTTPDRRVYGRDLRCIYYDLGRMSRVLLPCQNGRTVNMDEDGQTLANEQKNRLWCDRINGAIVDTNVQDPRQNVYKFPLRGPTLPHEEKRTYTYGRQRWNSSTQSYQWEETTSVQSYYDFPSKFLSYYTVWDGKPEMIGQPKTLRLYKSAKSYLFSNWRRDRNWNSLNGTFTHTAMPNFNCGYASLAVYVESVDENSEWDWWEGSMVLKTPVTLVDYTPVYPYRDNASGKDLVWSIDEEQILAQAETALREYLATEFPTFITHPAVIEITMTAFHGDSGILNLDTDLPPGWNWQP